MFESQWKPRPKPIRRTDDYWDGYNDALLNLRPSWLMLGGTDYESEEYRAGYLQCCAELAKGAS